MSYTNRTIYFTRHAQSANLVTYVWENGRRIPIGRRQTREDGLGETGNSQATQTGYYFRSIGVDAIMCSTLKRAKETTRIIASICSLSDTNHLSLLNEAARSVDGLDLRSKENQEYVEWRRFVIDNPTEENLKSKFDADTDSFADIIWNCQDIIQMLSTSPDLAGLKTVVVSHSHTLAMCLALIKCGPHTTLQRLIETFVKMHMENCAITKVTFTGPNKGHIDSKIFKYTGHLAHNPDDD